MKAAELNPTAARTHWGEDDVFLDPVCPVQVLIQAQSNTALHRHQFTELVVITAGTGIHRVEGLGYALAPGDCFVLEGAWSHAYLETVGLQLVNVLIRRPCLQRLRPAIRALAGYDTLFQQRGAGVTPFKRPRTLTPQALGECLHLIEALRDEADHSTDGRAAMQEALLQVLLITLCRHVAGKTIDLPKTHAPIAKVIRYLETHFSDEVSLLEIEQIGGMSARTLQRNFRTATGVTPIRYLLRLRIAHAVRLLSETTLSATEISAQCGIPDSAYFSRLFHQATGLCPSIWRKRASGTA